MARALRYMTLMLTIIRVFCSVEQCINRVFALTFARECGIMYINYGGQKLSLYEALAKVV